MLGKKRWQARQANQKNVLQSDGSEHFLWAFVDMLMIDLITNLLKDNSFGSLGDLTSNFSLKTRRKQSHL